MSAPDLPELPIHRPRIVRAPMESGGPIGPKTNRVVRSMPRTSHARMPARACNTQSPRSTTKLYPPWSGLEVLVTASTHEDALASAFPNRQHKQTPEGAGLREGRDGWAHYGLPRLPRCPFLTERTVPRRNLEQWPESTSTAAWRPEPARGRNDLYFSPGGLRRPTRSKRLGVGRCAPLRW